jgi:hypothetical protein
MSSRCRAGAEVQVQRFRCRGSGAERAEVQSWRAAQVQRNTGAEVQVQRFRCRRADGDAGADEVMQRDMVCRETDVEMLRCGGAELQRC